jgi:solute carrier family 25 folate transporter 32
VTVCFPLEVIKTRMQVQGSRGVQSWGLSSLQKVLNEEGVRGLFRGYLISAFCLPLFHTIYFPLYEKAKLSCKDTFGWADGSFKLYSLSAGVAGMSCNLLTNPFWMVRTRMQSEVFRGLCETTYRKKYPSNMFKSMYIIANEEGILTLYQGLAASCIGIAHPIIYFPLYEKSKIYFMENYEDPNATSLSSKYVMISAITCKILTSLLTYPHEIIRSR